MSLLCLFGIFLFILVQNTVWPKPPRWHLHFLTSHWFSHIMAQIVGQLLYFPQGSSPCHTQSKVVKAVGSRGQCCATDSAGRGVEILKEAKRNVHLSALSLAMITPFKLPAFTGSHWFLLICATLSGRQLGFGEKAKFCSCPCNLYFSRSSNAVWHDVGSTTQNKLLSNTHIHIFYFSTFYPFLPSPSLDHMSKHTPQANTPKLTLN